WLLVELDPSSSRSPTSPGRPVTPGRRCGGWLMPSSRNGGSWSGGSRPLNSARRLTIPMRFAAPATGPQTRFGRGGTGH
ncbi:MAG: hypothetical protein AVDCRST_MAG33-3198, partial [uncultured Thermomicrobiales bacterium]